MKKIIVVCLAVLMILSFCSCGGTDVSKPTGAPEPEVSAEQSTTKPEVAQAPNEEAALAVAYGLVPLEMQNGWSMTVTWSEYCRMLQNVIALHGGSIAEWEDIAAAALRSERPMQREGAILAVYEAACVLGMGASPNGDWLTVNKRFGDTAWDLDLSWDYPEFPAWKETSPFTDCGEPRDHMVAAFHFAQGQTSMASGMAVFDFDTEELSLHTQDDLSRGDAAVTVLRFYESIGAIADEATTAGILEAAKQRREAILLSETGIVKSDVFIPGETYTGTAYYVSNSGSDDNDGLSPETAWATISRINTAGLQPGDAAFFERGGVWRVAQSERLFCWEGVTYSAYGTGDKPRFYGSPEDGADPSKWTLYQEGENGEKIWAFYRDITDTGGVIFNGGESWAERVYGWWTGDGYVLFEEPGTAMAPEDCLGDLQFCSMIGYTGCDYPIRRYDLNLRGTLYLRCDAGNPGELYDSIEFETTDCYGWGGIVSAEGDGCVIDNLAVLYWGNVGIQSSLEWKNVTVQNCEVGWGGNVIHEFGQPEPTKDYMLSGDGIYGIYDGGVLRNNYCHDVDGNGITFEASKDTQIMQMQGDYHCAGNLIERCGQGVWLHDDYDVSSMNALYIEDNLILNIGYGYVHGCWCPMTAIAVDNLATKADAIYIRGNTVYLSTEELLRCTNMDDGRPVLEDNVFFRK